MPRHECPGGHFAGGTTMPTTPARLLVMHMLMMLQKLGYGQCMGPPFVTSLSTDHKTCFLLMRTENYKGSLFSWRGPQIRDGGGGGGGGGSPILWGPHFCVTPEYLPTPPLPRAPKLW